jgi:hypothetical protein
VHLVAREGILRREALGDHRAVEFLDRDPLRREDAALVGRAIGSDGGVLLMQPGREAARLGVLEDALQGEEAAAAHQRGLDLSEAPPAVHAAMGVDDLLEQCVHPASPWLQSFATYLPEGRAFS